MPEPTLRQKAIDDTETIHARMVELEAERLAALNLPAEEEGGVQH